MVFDFLLIWTPIYFWDVTHVPYYRHMNSNAPNNFFGRLIAPLLTQLERIAHGTRGEQSVDDLKTEAWLAAQDIQHEAGREFEPEDEGFQRAILSKLQKAFGRFVNQKLRFAVRLDQEQVVDSGEVRQNSVAATLAAPATYQPETALELAEEECDRRRRLTDRFAEAIAYFRALDHFDGNHEVLATHLAVSVGVLRTRFGRAEIAFEQQPSLFDGIEVVPADFAPIAGRFKRSNPRWMRNWGRVCSLTRPMQLRIFHARPLLFGRRFV